MGFGFKRFFISAFTMCLCGQAFAEQTKIELTPFLGQVFTDELLNQQTSEAFSLSNDPNIGFSFAWQDSPNGQGQILLNYSKHDFNSQLDNSEQSLDILYGHFSGIAQYRQNSYVTTVSLGLGGAHFKTDNSSDVYPSLTMAVGTRYEFSQNLALVTELRAYGSLVDTDSEVFCKSDNCTAAFENSVWVDSTVWLGVAFKF